MVTEEQAVEVGFARQLLSLFVYVIGGVLVIGGLLALVWVGRPYAALYLTSKKAALAKQASAGSVKGDRLIIPDVIVDAKILEGSTISNLEKGVAHVAGTAQPGAAGNVIIEGHNYAQVTNGNAFFSLLHLIRDGTNVYLYKDGRRYVYRVVGKRVQNARSPKLYQASTKEKLTLITCASDLSSLSMVSPTKRIVVTAVPVE